MVPIRLEVYVDDDCLNCSRSAALAAEVQAAFPGIEVAVLEPPHERGTYRHLVAAVPTYILNGTIVSLGNPTFARLSEVIEELAVGVRRW